MTHRIIYTLSFSIFLALTLLTIQQSFASSSHAQEGADITAVDVETESKPPFQLPFAEPPGPNTWLMAQPYGNTTGAYFQRNTLYRASGGIHFGLDLAAPCGTEIVAMADGVVFQVDGSFGSPPHNLMVDHPQLNYSSMYGHLLEAPPLSPGQRVTQGQVIAKVGDSAGDCYRSPHLHLEIRDLRHFHKYNPVTLIEANWHNLAMYGTFGRGFMKNLDNPRQWQQVYDQPQAQVGGPILNEFTRTWPLDWSKSTTEIKGTPTPAITTLTLAKPTPLPLAKIPPPLEPAMPTNIKQLTKGNCCTNIRWNEDSTEIHFIDQPSSGKPVGIWGIDVNQVTPQPYLVQNRLGVLNGDSSLLAYPDRRTGEVIIEDLAADERWRIDTMENGIVFTPDGHLLWTEYDSEVEWRARTGQVWLADIDGSHATQLAQLDRGGPVAWISATELLIAQRIPPKLDILLSTLSIEDGTLTELVQLPRTRGSAFSPDKRYMAYLVRFNNDGLDNGVWLLDLEDPNLEAQLLPFFGSYRWRDNERLVYIPFTPDASGVTFYEYNIVTQESRPLYPQDGSTLNLTIANNDWQISPNGRKLAMVTAQGQDLNGIWVADIAE